VRRRFRVSKLPCRPPPARPAADPAARSAPPEPPGPSAAGMRQQQQDHQPATPPAPPQTRRHAAAARHHAAAQPESWRYAGSEVETYRVLLEIVKALMGRGRLDRLSAATGAPLRAFQGRP